MILRPRRLAVIAACGAAVWILGSLLAAHLISRRPRPPYDEAVPRVPWATTEELELEASDGARVKGFALVRDESAPTAVLLHMNRADRGAMLPAAEVWGALGWNSVAVTLRSHGDAEGGRLAFGRNARLDAAAAVAFARDRFDGRLAVHGVSLGSAAALFAAAEGSLTADAFVFEAPYTNVVDATYSRTALFLPPLLDRVAGWSLLTVAPLFVEDVRSISPLEAAAALPGDAPVLLLGGLRDRYALPDQVRRFEEVLGERATLEFADVGHTEWLAHPDQLRDTLGAWLDARGLASGILPARGDR